MICLSDVLSQEEIDRLLAALSQGEVNIEEVKKEGEEKKSVPMIFCALKSFQRSKLEPFK